MRHYVIPSRVDAAAANAARIHAQLRSTRLFAVLVCERQGAPAMCSAHSKVCACELVRFDDVNVGHPVRKYAHDETRLKNTQRIRSNADTCSASTIWLPRQRRRRVTFIVFVAMHIVSRRLVL